MNRIYNKPMVFRILDKYGYKVKESYIDKDNIFHYELFNINGIEINVIHYTFLYNVEIKVNKLIKNVYLYDDQIGKELEDSIKVIERDENIKKLI